MLIVPREGTPSPAGQPYPLVGVTPSVASWSSAGHSSQADAIQHFETELGGCTVYRVFSSNNIGTWNSGIVNTVRNTAPDATVWHSFKTWDETAITAWINDAPTLGGTPKLLTFHHEPENDGWSASQILTWKQRVSDLVDLRDATGRTDVLVGPILMSDWTLNPLSGRDFWGNWYVGPPIPGYTPGGYPTDYRKSDFYGWDPYNEGSDQDPAFYNDPSDTLDDQGTGTVDGTRSIFDAHVVMNIPIAIGEFGSQQIPSDGDDTGRAAWLADYIDTLLDLFTVQSDLGVTALAYWSDFVGGQDTRINNSQPCLDALAGYCAASRAEWGL